MGMEYENSEKEDLFVEIKHVEEKKAEYKMLGVVQRYTPTATDDGRRVMSKRLVDGKIFEQTFKVMWAEEFYKLPKGLHNLHVISYGPMVEC